MKKALLLVIPIIFTAQACDLLGTGAPKGSGSLGVFLSVDSGDSWHPGVGTQKLPLSNVAVAKLFVQGDKPQNLVIASANYGLLASDDHGENWIQMLPDFLAYDAFINPFNEKEIFASGSKGRLAAIYKSPDRGGTWLQVYNEPAGEGAVSALAFDPRNAKIMYAGLTNGALLESTDGGDTWHILTNFKDRVVDVAVGRSAIFSLNVKTGLSRSTDGGKTWTIFKLDKLDKVFNDLYIDRENDSVIYVGSDAGLSRSTDGGTTWTKLPVPASAKVSNVTAVQVNPVNVREIFAAVKSTIYRSDDNGQTWRTVQLPTNRVVSDIAVDPMEPNRIYAGLRL